MTKQSLVTPMCRCGRAAPPPETPAPSGPSLEQQLAADLAKESLSLEDYTGVKTKLTGETLGLKEQPLEDVTPTTPTETNSLGLTQPKDIRVRREGQRKANVETPMETTCTDKDLWTVLPFVRTA